MSLVRKTSISIANTFSFVNSYTSIIIYVIIPMIISVVQFHVLRPFFVAAHPNFYENKAIGGEELNLIQTLTTQIQVPFYFSLVIAVLILNAFYEFVYSTDNKFISKVKYYIFDSVFDKFILLIFNAALVMYFIQYVFVFLYFKFIIIDKNLDPVTSKFLLFQVTDDFLAGVATVIAIIAAVYPLLFVILPWEQNKRVETAVRIKIEAEAEAEAKAKTIVPLGFDVEKIREWIGPAAEKLATNNKLSQDAIAAMLKEATDKGSDIPPVKHTTVGRWYNGTTPMPPEVIGFFLMHGVMKFFNHDNSDR